MLQFRMDQRPLPFVLVLLHEGQLGLSGSFHQHGYGLDLARWLLGQEAAHQMLLVVLHTQVNVLEVEVHRRWLLQLVVAQHAGSAVAAVVRFDLGQFVTFQSLFNIIDSSWLILVLVSFG